ncbi:MAG: hypothetical protein ABR583_11695 [Gaiellaceae bacterium]
MQDGITYIIAFSFTRGAHEEAARARQEGLEIGLVQVSTLLDNPLDKPVRPGLADMASALLAGAQDAARRHGRTSARAYRGRVGRRLNPGDHSVRIAVFDSQWGEGVWMNNAR